MPAHVVNGPMAMAQRDLAGPSGPMAQRDPVKFNDPSGPVKFNDPTRPSDPARPSDAVLTQPSHMLIDWQSISGSLCLFTVTVSDECHDINIARDREAACTEPPR